MVPSYCIDVSSTDEEQVLQGDFARQVYTLVCRKDFTQPGFALIRFANEINSVGLRRELLSLKEHLSVLHQTETGNSLAWFNMNRFDQQNTTKFHRDGAPADSVIILGYEPSAVESCIAMADYSKCSYELGISPDEFLETFNPMYEKGMEKLQPHITRLDVFSPSRSQILVVNNSSNAYENSPRQWLGVLHSATVFAAEGEHRVINSTCIYPLGSDEVDDGIERQLEFLKTDALAGSY